MMEQNPAEAALVQRLQDPNTRSQAFSEIITAFQQRLYWHIRRIVISHENADDVLQNTFMKAWTNIERFRGDARLSTWLFRIATNESIDYLNKIKREVQVFSDEDSTFLESTLTSDPYFDGDQLQQDLQKAILRLPEKQRLVFNMRYFEEMKYDEMSQVLGTTVGALKATYHIAQKKIQDYFQTRD